MKKPRLLNHRAILMLRWIAASTKVTTDGHALYWCAPYDNHAFVTDPWGTFSVFISTEHYAAIRTLDARGLTTPVVEAQAQWARRVTPAGREELSRAMSGEMVSTYQPLIQTSTWGQTSGSRYAKDRCCRCGKKTGGKPAAWLLIARDAYGDWYVVRPGSPPIPNEGMDADTRDTDKDRVVLPIGPECLRAAPGLAIGSVPKPVF